MALVFALPFAAGSSVPGGADGTAGPIIRSLVGGDYVVAYAASKTVKVNWRANGGKIGSKTSVTTKEPVGKKIGKLPKSPKRLGYLFKGWYTKKTAGKKVTKNTKAKKNMSVYARWAAREYTLTFDANGGSCATKSRKVKFKKPFGTLPTPTRASYTFTGWYTAKTGGVKVSAATTMSAKNINLYARWHTEKKLVILAIKYATLVSSSAKPEQSFPDRFDKDIMNYVFVPGAQVRVKANMPDGIAFTRWIDMAGNELPSTFFAPGYSAYMSETVVIVKDDIRIMPTLLG
ncbi:MAG: InlB B-repeat-containing protein [Candidatus Nomurabacteria bacterium]|nr:InlB B-repeat-containing protein [Candidatus Nomurabacteria bacterium]